MPTLNWIGKEAVVEHHKEVPFHLLRCNPELSVGEPGSGNLLVQGDNLLALKALLPYIRGRSSASTSIRLIIRATKAGSITTT
jgi:adenine-specific DNA-methyltransferase